MKNYQHWSTEALNDRKLSLLDDIDQWERFLVNTHSKLIQLSLNHYIKKAKKKFTPLMQNYVIEIIMINLC